MKDGYSDSMSEHWRSHSCLITLKKYMRVFPSIGLMFYSTSTLCAEVWNLTVSVRTTTFSSLKSYEGSSRFYHSECLSSLMTTELLMSWQKVKNWLWANVSWNTFQSSQRKDIHPEWRNSSRVLVRELLARFDVSCEDFKEYFSLEEDDAISQDILSQVICSFSISK